MIELKSVRTPTNGDRMRARSDEKIAHSRITRDFVLFCALDVPGELFETYEEAYAAEFDWLRQPADDMSARDHENIKGVEIDPVKKEISQ